MPHTRIVLELVAILAVLGHPLISSAASKVDRSLAIPQPYEIVAQTGHTATIKALSFVPLSTHTDRRLKTSDAQDARDEIDRFRLISTSNDETVKVWDLRKARATLTYTDPDKENVVVRIAGDPNGKLLATASDSLVSLRTLDGTRQLASPKVFLVGVKILSVAFVNNGNVVAVATSKDLQLISTTSHKEFPSLNTVVDELAVNSDGSLIVGVKHHPESNRCDLYSWQVTRSGLHELAHQLGQMNARESGQLI